MIKYYFTFVILLLISHNIRCQEINESYASLYLDIIEKYFFPDIGEGVAYYHKKRSCRESRFTLYYNVKDMFGSLYFEKYRDRNMDSLVLSGYYLGNPDIMKSMFPVINPETLLEEYELIKYFHPLRDGEWKSYNKDGSLNSIIIWNKGKMIE